MVRPVRHPLLPVAHPLPIRPVIWPAQPHLSRPLHLPPVRPVIQPVHQPPPIQPVQLPPVQPAQTQQNSFQKYMDVIFCGFICWIGVMAPGFAEFKKVQVTASGLTTFLSICTIYNLIVDCRKWHARWRANAMNTLGFFIWLCTVSSSVLACVVTFKGYHTVVILREHFDPEKPPPYPWEEVLWSVGLFAIAMISLALKVQVEEPVPRPKNRVWSRAGAWVRSHLSPEERAKKRERRERQMREARARAFARCLARLREQQV